MRTNGWLVAVSNLHPGWVVFVGNALFEYLLLIRKRGPGLDMWLGKRSARHPFPDVSSSIPFQLSSLTTYHHDIDYSLWNRPPNYQSPLEIINFHSRTNGNHLRIWRSCGSFAGSGWIATWWHHHRICKAPRRCSGTTIIKILFNAAEASLLFCCLEFLCFDLNPDFQPWTSKNRASP